MMLSRILLATVCLFVAVVSQRQCPPIDAAFRRVATDNESAACQCFEDGFYHDVDGISIGCSGQMMARVHTALATLNGTSVGQLRIWDSLIDIVPNDMFAAVSPKSLSIERSGVGVLYDPFSRLGPRLKQLKLKGNILISLDDNLLKGLVRLQTLDLSSNKISSIAAGVLDASPDIRELYLDNNQIGHIEDGAFKALKGLRKLSLAGNQLTNITKDTFKGLEALEVLSLQNNRITSVDWAAFASMKKLRTLDFGTNHITDVELRGLEKLEKLFINNNSIQSLKQVSLRDLPGLVLISMDRNNLSEIAEGDLFGLARSTRLESLTLAANNISTIGARALSPIQHVSILAMQNNHLSALNADGQPFLRPLRRLSTLLVSGNKIAAIAKDDLPKSITTLAADHNHMQKIEAGSFDGIAMQRLYINNNQLVFLPRHLFDSFSLDVLEAIDIGDNRWQCVCNEEWLGDWIDSFSSVDVGYGVLGCLVIPGCGMSSNHKDETTKAPEGRDWVTIISVLMAVVSVLMLVSIAYLFFTDNKHKIILMRPLSRRVGSDLHKLITDNDPLVEKDANEQQKRISGDKKRVRFEDK